MTDGTRLTWDQLTDLFQGSTDEAWWAELRASAERVFAEDPAEPVARTIGGPGYFVRAGESSGRGLRYRRVLRLEAYRHRGTD